MTDSPAPFPPDRAAREAAADPARNVVLRASAGTGKTTVLTQRYLRLVECGVPPRNILALTFTRKAAQEMKDRIVAELGSAERRRALAGRGDLAEVNIATLDAFTLGLLREFPLDAGVSPGIEVLDERSMPVVRAEAVGRVFSGATGFDAETLGALPLLLDRSRTAVEAAVHNYLERRLSWRRYFEAKAREARRRPAPRVPRLRDFFREAAPSYDRLREAGADAGIPLPVRLALRLEEQDSARDALDREALERFFPVTRKTPPKTLPKELGADFRAVAECVREFRPVWLDFLNERAFGPVWEVFQAVEAEYQRLKCDRGVMDFDDLTVAATRLLEGLGEFSASRFRLEARYHHLLLDEFHDTSDAQWDLLRAILRPWSEGMGLAAEEVARVTRGRLSKPTIFVVGDHKQSIYRFRDARVEILGQAEEAIRSLRDPAGEPDPRLVLRWNFRSIRRLRRFVNSASKSIAEAPGTASEADWAFRYSEDDLLPEHAGPDDEAPGEGAPSRRPALAVAATTKAEAPKDAAAKDAAAKDPGEQPTAHEQAAERIAERIRALIEEGGVRPEQIALLARVTTQLPTYRAAVERRGIPTYLMKGAGFFETSEVRDLRALVRYLARPHSDRRAAELLRSRFLALPGDDFARLRRARAPANPAATPFADLLRSGGDGLPAELDEGCAARLRRAAAPVPGWARLSRRLPPSRTIARILEETRYVERAGAPDSPEARQQAANVQKTIRLLRGFERGGFAGMERVAEGLAAAAAGDETQAAVAAAGAVQALSIHAAKGLEFEHVFLVDCGGGGRRDTGIPRVQERGDGDWTIALIRDASPWKLDDGGRADSEERRCLYVAMTRAKRSLTLSWTVRFRKDGAPWKPAGLAALLPAGLYREASRTAKEPAERIVRRIVWEGHEIEVLPAPRPDPGPPRP